MFKGHNWRICRVCGEDHGIPPSLGRHPSEDTRKKLSIAKKGKPLSEDHRRKISVGNKGKPLLEDHKRKISVARMGQTPSEESRKKMSEAQMGEKSHNYGKHFSEEIKKKMSIAQKEIRASGDFVAPFVSPTSIEIMLREFLEDNSIPYSTKEIIDIGYKSRNPDAFIEPNIIIEADGTYTHSENCHGDNRKLEDERDDKVMKEIGYIIYRIPEPDFRNGKYLETLNMIVNIHHLNS